MDRLSEVLKRIEQNVMLKEHSQNTLHMQPLGLESSVGHGNTQLSRYEKSEAPNQEARETSLENIQQEQLKSLSEKGASFDEIKSMVDICFDSLDTYGKTPEQVHSIVKLFCTVFEGYPISKVRNAFRQWVKTSNKFPTPADIEKIINPPVVEWKPDWAAYTALKKRIQNDWYYPLSDERDFLRRCEEYAYRRASATEDTTPDERQARQLMITNQQEE